MASQGVRAALLAVAEDMHRLHLTAEDRAALARDSETRKKRSKRASSVRDFSDAERAVLAQLVTELADRASETTNAEVSFASTAERSAYEKLAAYARQHLAAPAQRRKRIRKGAAYGPEWARGLSSRLGRVLTLPHRRRIDIRQDGKQPLQYSIDWTGGHNVVLAVDLFEGGTQLTAPVRTRYELDVVEETESVSLEHRHLLENAWSMLAAVVATVFPKNPELVEATRTYQSDFRGKIRKVGARIAVVCLVAVLGGCGVALGRKLSPGFKRATDKAWQIISGQEAPTPSQPAPSAPPMPPSPSKPRVRPDVAFLRGVINGVFSSCEHNELSASVRWTAPEEARGPLFVVRNDEVIARLPDEDRRKEAPVFIDKTVMPSTTYCYALAVQDAASGDYLAGSCTETTTPVCERENHPPVVAGDLDFVSEQEKAPQLVDISVEAFDLDHDRLTYEWLFGDTWRPEVTRVPEVSHVFYYGGVYDVSVTVRDGRGGARYIASKLEVDGEPPPPFDSTASGHREVTLEERWNHDWGTASSLRGTMEETVFTFTVTPKPLANNTGAKPLRYRWSFEDCHLRAYWSNARVRVDGVAGVPALPRNVQCAVTTTVPSVQHTFRVPGPMQVLVTVIYDTGEMVTRHLGVVQVHPNARWTQWFKDHPSACPVCCSTCSQAAPATTATSPPSSSP